MPVARRYPNRARTAQYGIVVPRFKVCEQENGAPGTIRTSDPQIRSLVLYPAELRAL